MLYDAIESPGEATPAEVLDRYEAALAEAVESMGRERAVEATGLDAETVAAIAAGDAGGIDLRDAAAVIAAASDTTREAVLTDVRDRLLLEMSSAMLDVEAVATDLGGDLDPKEVHAKVEGRLPMTLEEYATLHHHVASAKP